MNEKVKISKLKRHSISAVRVFLSAFIGTLSLQILSLPQNGIRDFFVSAFISGIVAGVSALLKWMQEALFPISK